MWNNSHVSVVHGRACIRKNGMFYAIDIRPNNSLADKIARATNSTGTYWDRVNQSSKSARIMGK